MNQDELAFFNQQLAAMLREGIPLEGALKQLGAGMRRGQLRRELEQIERDLARGVPLHEALQHRSLPDLYVRMVQVGARSNDLPGVLTLLADHYHRSHLLWTRLKGLMVYPVIVLVASFALSALLAFLYLPWTESLMSTEAPLWRPAPKPASPVPPQVWIVLPACLLGLLLTALGACLSVPALRRRMVWTLPAFKDASLARFASCMELTLKAGNNLEDSLALARALEGPTPLGRELRAWERRLAGGGRRLREIGQGSRMVPPLFLWLVDSCAEDMPEGFAQASRIYGARAAARAEMLLYAALPLSILALAVLIVGQMVPLMRFLTQSINALFW